MQQWGLAMRYLRSYATLLILLGCQLAEAQVLYDTSSTAAEGYQRGLGSVINAQGQRNLSNSQAAINMTDARSNQIDNQVKSVNAYWEKNDIYEQHVQEKLSEIDAKRARYEARHGLKSLTPDQFDRTTGQIIWPKVLEQSQYDQYRKKLDELFHKRSYEGFLSSDEYMAATTAMNDWHKMMVSQKDDYPGPILDQMLKFVLSVKRELDDNLS
jgi:hypothetical protein